MNLDKIVVAARPKIYLSLVRFTGNTRILSERAPSTGFGDTREPFGDRSPPESCDHGAIPITFVSCSIRRLRGADAPQRVLAARTKPSSRVLPTFFRPSRIAARSGFDIRRPFSAVGGASCRLLVPTAPPIRRDPTTRRKSSCLACGRFTPERAWNGEVIVGRRRVSQMFEQ